MKSLFLYISKDYLDYNYIERVLKILDKSFNFIITKPDPDLLRICKNNTISISLIPKEDQHNFIREESFGLLLFYDYKDDKAQDILKFCLDRNKLVIIKALPNERYVF